jgi:hypothetical protein
MMTLPPPYHSLFVRKIYTRVKKIVMLSLRFKQRPIYLVGRDYRIIDRKPKRLLKLRVGEMWNHMKAQDAMTVFIMLTEKELFMRLSIVNWAAWKLLYRDSSTARRGFFLFFFHAIHTNNATYLLTRVGCTKLAQVD